MTLNTPLFRFNFNKAVTVINSPGVGVKRSVGGRGIDISLQIGGNFRRPHPRVRHQSRFGVVSNTANCFTVSAS